MSSDPYAQQQFHDAQQSYHPTQQQPQCAFEHRSTHQEMPSQEEYEDLHHLRSQWVDMPSFDASDMQNLGPNSMGSWMDLQSDSIVPVQQAELDIENTKEAASFAAQNIASQSFGEAPPSTVQIHSHPGGNTIQPFTNSYPTTPHRDVLMPHSSFGNYFPDTPPPTSEPAQRLRPTAPVFVPQGQYFNPFGLKHAALAGMSVDTMVAQQQTPAGSQMLSTPLSYTPHTPENAPSSTSSYFNASAPDANGSSPLQQRRIATRRRRASTARQFAQLTQPPTANFQGWQAGTAPSENIPLWAEGSFNLQRTPSAVHLQVPAQTPHRGRKKAKSVASNSMSFTCSTVECGESFDSKTKLNHHERYHRKRECPCPESGCNKAFFFPKDLKRHLENSYAHNPNGPKFFCNVEGCRYKTQGFPRKDHLVRHARTHTPPLPTRPSSAPSQC